MISRKSGIRCANTGSNRASCANASPMISNCRSTADLSTISASKSPKLLPAVIVALASAASCASHSKLFGSRRKQRLPRGVDAGPQIGIVHGTGLDEIDRPAEKGLESVLEIEIGFERQRVGMAAIELDQKIHVAAFGVEITARGGAEHIEPAHMVAPAQRVRLFVMLHDFVYHLRPASTPQYSTARLLPRIRGRCGAKRRGGGDMGAHAPPPPCCAWFPSPALRGRSQGVGARRRRGQGCG